MDTISVLHSRSDIPDNTLFLLSTLPSHHFHSNLLYLTHQLSAHLSLSLFLFLFLVKSIFILFSLYLFCFFFYYRATDSLIFCYMRLIQGCYYLNTQYIISLTVPYNIRYMTFLCSTAYFISS